MKRGFTTRVRKDKRVGVKPNLFDKIKNLFISIFTERDNPTKTPPVVEEPYISHSLAEETIYHIKYIQGVLGLKQDGIVGSKTLGAIANYLGCESNIFDIQRCLGLKPEGVLDPKTSKKLHESIIPRVWSVRGGLSLAAYNLILKYEVGGGEEYYTKHLRYPTWPGGASGVTIGIGYDLGYNTKTQFKKDWKQHLSKDDFVLLEQQLKKKGEEAKNSIKSVKHIDISWESAEDVFKTSTLPRFVELTKKTFPGAEKLHPDIFGALVSIVFNRGGSTTGDRRKEMRMIKKLIQTESDDPNLKEQIADQVIAMKRLWEGKGLDGLLTRRDSEAKLIRNAV